MLLRNMGGKESTLQKKANDPNGNLQYAWDHNIGGIFMQHVGNTRRQGHWDSERFYIHNFESFFVFGV